MISDTKLYEVAYSYYVQGRRQQEIAKELNVSHVQVSKYLKLAEEKGIVEINVNPPYVSSEIHQRLRDYFLSRFSLENLVLVPEARSEQNRFSFLVKGAADYMLEKYPEEDINIGFGLGRTITELSRYKIRASDKRSRWKFYPLPNYRISRESQENEYYAYLSILQNFVQSWGAGVDKRFLRISTLEDGSRVFKELLEEDFLSSLDVVIGGVGVTLSREPNVREMVFGHDLAASLVSVDIRGDYLNYFFDGDGNIITPRQDPLHAVSIEDIKRIPHKIAIASGYQKVLSILGLLECSLVDTLVTDVETAKLIMGYTK